MSFNIEKAEEKLSNPKREIKRLHFPDDVYTEGTQNIIRFQFSLPAESKYFSNGQYTRAKDKDGNLVSSNYRRPGANSLARRLGENYTRTTTEIDLFMPAQINTNYAADWGGSSLGGLGTAIDAGSGIAAADSITDAWNDIWSVVGRNWGEVAFNTGVGVLQGLTPINAMDARRFFSSFAFNPYIEVIFNGVSNRTFSFSFKMIARNKKEQETIRQIVKEFKFHRSPEFRYEGQYNYYRFPSEVDIQFIRRGEENEWLFKFSTCALTNVSVDYTPDGNFASHEDGAPFSVVLSIELTELETLTKERIEEGY